MRRFAALLGLVCLAAAGSASGDEVLHEMMTKDELLEVFRLEAHAVPEYEVIPVHFPKEHKRAPGSATGLHFNAFGRDIKLWLNPTEGILAGEDTPVYVTRSATTGRNKRAANFRMFRVPNVMADVGRMLEDIEKQATVVVRKMSNGKEAVSGIVGTERLVVRPLPTRVNEHYSRQRRSADEVDHEVIAEEPHYHVVYKLPEQDPKSRFLVKQLEAGSLEKQLNRSRREIPVPETIYPQVLVFADFATYKLHGQNIYKLLEYMLPFWNGVDLRYRSLESPKVRFNIAGVIIGQDETALPFVKLQSSKSMWINLSLRELSNFLTEIEKVVPKSSYDLAIAMGPYQMCDSADGHCEILGLAYLGAACSRLRTGVIMDMGGFDGIDTAAHEIGHLFGADHDGSGDGVSCPGSDGYIMTPNSIRTQNMAYWSSCSLKAFDKFLRYLDWSDPSCLFDEPTATKSVPRVMPGRLMTLNEQCQKYHGTDYCTPMNLQGDDICIKLPCYVKGTRYQCSSSSSPADGTICGENKVCISAKCVDQSLFI